MSEKVSPTDSENFFILECADHKIEWCDHKKTLLTEHPDLDWKLVESVLESHDDEPVYFGVPYVPTYRFYIAVGLTRQQDRIWRAYCSDEYLEPKPLGLISVGEGLASLRLMVADHWTQIVTSIEGKYATVTQGGNIKCESSSHSYTFQKEIEEIVKKSGGSWVIANKASILLNQRCILCHQAHNAVTSNPDLVPEA